jgi:hypothetical protein
VSDRDAEGNRWTLDTLRVLIEANDLRYSQRFQAQSEALAAAFTAQQNAVSAALSAADRAVAKAENAAERRFEAVNEFRAALGDQSKLMMPRTEVEERLRSMKELIDKLGDRQRDIDSRHGGIKDTGALLISLLGIGVAIVSVLFVIFKSAH